MENQQIEEIFNNGWNSCIGRLKSVLNEKHIDSLEFNQLLVEMELPEETPEETLPPITKDIIIFNANSQISVAVSPAEGYVKLDSKLIEEELTPCEALEISQALMQAVQVYLYNQEQYRKEVVGPRIEITRQITETTTKTYPPVIKPLEPLKIKFPYNLKVTDLVTQICKHFSIPYIEDYSDINHVGYILGVNE